MKITAITKYKHGELYAILKRLNWTQSELARRCGMYPSLIGHIINLQRRPNEAQANAIQKALGEVGQFLDVLSEWPEAFTGLAKDFKHEQTQEVELDRLLDHREVLQIAAPDPEDTTEMDSVLNEVLETIPKREKTCLIEHFFNSDTYAEAGKTLGTSGMRVKQLEAAALRKLRHPARLRKLAAIRYGADDPTVKP
jgi:RNA polymerase sigma factor (sigma-70 family)